MTRGELQFAAGPHFFRFRARDIDPFRTKFVACLDPIHNTRRDRHTLRQRHARITHLRRRERPPALHSTAPRDRPPDPKVHPRAGFPGALRLRGEPAITARDRWHRERLFRIAAVVAFPHAARFLPGVRAQHRALRARGAIGRQRHKRHRRDTRRFHHLRSQAGSPSMRVQNRPRHGLWLGSAGTPRNVDSTSWSPNAGVSIPATGKPIPLRGTHQMRRQQRRLELHAVLQRELS